LISTDFAALAFEIVISLPGRALKFSKSNLPAAELTFCKSIVPIALMVILPVTKAASLTVTVPFETKLRLSLACSAFNVIPLLLDMSILPVLSVTTLTDFPPPFIVRAPELLGIFIIAELR
jgi:hypothetical protein